METGVYVFGSIRPVGFCGVVVLNKTVSSCETFQSLFEFTARNVLVLSTKGRYLQSYSKNIIYKCVKSRDTMTDSVGRQKYFQNIKSNSTKFVPRLQVK